MNQPENGHYERDLPWARVWWRIRGRCNWKSGKYYKKGIKCFLTKDDVETLWKRDRANTLKHPSIDRIDSDGDYVFENCRFIESSENSRRGRRRSEKSIIEQYDTLGNFIKRHYGAKETAKEFKISPSVMSGALNGTLKTAGGYVWKVIKRSNCGISFGKYGWSKKHKKCRMCGLDKFKHASGGVCSRCYDRKRRGYAPLDDVLKLIGGGK